MTRQAAEQTLTGLEASSTMFDGTDVQGRWLAVRRTTPHDGHTYHYSNEAITRQTALVILQNR